MKIFCINVYRMHEEGVCILTSILNYDNVGFFYRSSYRELVNFASTTCIGRAKGASLMSATYENYICHMRITPSGLGLTVLTDAEYEARVAFALLDEVLKLFKNQVEESTWMVVKKDSNITVPGLEELLKKYQTPIEVDKIAKIQKELNETKEIVQKTLEQLLDRDEKLSDLVEKSNNLSFQSKVFASNSRKLNSCCAIV